MSAPARDYASALARLYALAPRGIVLGLEPMRAALRAFGDPHARMASVHVAGTNGKGSTCAMIESALRSAGKRTALYTSPHLHRFSERMRIDGAPASNDSIACELWRLFDAIDAGKAPVLTFFEAATLTAWNVFARTNVDIVILEVGLGGRLDATNLCAPSVTAITRIARDHEALLGDTIASIATEKAGILKPGVPCVLGPALRTGEARDAIVEVATRVGAPILDARPSVAMPALAGEHQRENGATASTVLRVLGVPDEAIVTGFARTVWPARMERTGRWLFDAAHNVDGVEALVRALRTMDVPTHRRGLVFGASRDKDWRGMIERLAPEFPEARRWWISASVPRALPPGALCEVAGGMACTSVRDAVERAESVTSDDALVLVCGSIYAVAEVRARVLGIPADPAIAM